MVDSAIPKKFWPKKREYVCLACPVVNTKACDHCVLASWNVEALQSWAYDKHPQVGHSPLTFPVKPQVKLPRVVVPSHNIIARLMRGQNAV